MELSARIRRDSCVGPVTVAITGPRESCASLPQMGSTIGRAQCDFSPATFCDSSTKHQVVDFFWCRSSQMLAGRLTRNFEHFHMIVLPQDRSPINDDLPSRSQTAAPPSGSTRRFAFAAGSFLPCQANLIFQYSPSWLCRHITVSASFLAMN